ncbi:hypothetical protein [Paenibacillus sp. FSL H3-0286]|uniref:hypothetical protein n=1 Tax=Paenibacillus sp. FSL H3-0286 TaxID=2921427 RepID=UPI003252F693
MNDNNELRQQLDTIISQIMTTEEASTIWGLSQDRIKVLCSLGQVIAVKRGKTWLLLREQPNPKQKQ